MYKRSLPRNQCTKTGLHWERHERRRIIINYKNVYTNAYIEEANKYCRPPPLVYPYLCTILLIFYNQFSTNAYIALAIEHIFLDEREIGQTGHQ